MCKICDKEVYRDGLCDTHYFRKKRMGISTGHVNIISDYCIHCGWPNIEPIIPFHRGLCYDCYSEGYYERGIFILNTNTETLLETIHFEDLVPTFSCKACEKELQENKPFCQECKKKQERYCSACGRIARVKGYCMNCYQKHVTRKKIKN